MKHYHIICASKIWPHPEIVTVTEDSSHTMFINIVQSVYDLCVRYSKDEHPLLSWTEHEALFENGTIVHIKVCKKNCIEELDMLLEKTSGCAWASLADNIFYQR